MRLTDDASAARCPYCGCSELRYQPLAEFVHQSQNLFIESDTEQLSMSDVHESELLDDEDMEEGLSTADYRSTTSPGEGEASLEDVTASDNTITPTVLDTDED